MIISFDFPPDNTIGALRAYKFAKYLPYFGWDPIILTAQKMNKSSQLSISMPCEKNIIRTPYFILYDSLFRARNQNISLDASAESKCKVLPHLNKIVFNGISLIKPFIKVPIIDKLITDPLGWYNPSVKAGLEIIKNDNINIIFSSFMPSISHLIASELHNRTKIPWVAEFRDPWSFNAYTSQAQPFHFFEQLWEKRTLKGSELLVSVTRTWAHKLENLHKKRVIVISNGFDEEDYLDNLPPSSKFILTYTGNIYFGKRDPSILFKVIYELKKEGFISQDNFEIRFFGYNLTQYIIDIAKKNNISGLIKVSDKIPFRDSIHKQMESTALLLLSWDDPKDMGTVPGKIFEYLGAKRPIIALAFKGGEIDKLLQETCCGVVVNDAFEIKNLLINWIEEYKNTGKISKFYNPKVDVINNYTRKNQAKALAEVFNNIQSADNNISW